MRATPSVDAMLRLPKFDTMPTITGRGLNAHSLECTAIKHTCCHHMRLAAKYTTLVVID